MKKNEEALFEQVFLTCPQCSGPQKVIDDSLNEDGNLVITTSCEVCESVWNHTIITTEE